jgi:archaemetzincin
MKASTMTPRIAGRVLVGFASLLLMCGACSAQHPPEAPLPQPFAKLLPLHKRLGPPGPGEWLAVHQEPGQTYDEYVRGKPIRPDATRRVIYVQPLGTLSKTERKIVQLTADYMEPYFGLQVKILDELPLSLIPEKARRVHPTWNVPQILAPYVLDDVLAPRLPKDAVASIAFTASDLWPGEGWNFVFGEASLSNRVGVWSLSRYGNPDANEAAFRLCLLRTLKVGTHETGHMFSIAHCIRYECNMQGSNSLAEGDKCPLWLCPECLAKLCYATGADPIKRYQRLAAFCKAQGLTREQEFFEKSVEVLSKP